MTGDLLTALSKIVGREHVLVDDDQRAGYETDWTGRFHGTARAVVRPSDTAQVATLLELCHERRLPVVAQGGNTGLVGGSVPDDAIVLSSARLSGIAIDPANGEAIVGAGVVLERLQEDARAAGWEFGVDLSARGSCTLGGMVATNVGGEHVFRYGTMKDQLIGVEAVLANGTIVGHVPALRKDNTGYHWEALLAGSEGTLAVITRAHVKLVPRHPARCVAIAGLDDLSAALGLAAALRRGLPELMALEVCFDDGMALVREYAGLPAPYEPARHVNLLVETAGDDESAMVQRLARCIEVDGGARATAVATAPGDRARLWRYRELHTEAISSVGIPHKLDVTLPFDRLVEFESRVRGIAAEAGADIFLFGHLGDGNMHVNLLGAEPDATPDDEVLDLAVALGGSISAEHGIGRAKLAAFTRSKPPAEVAAMQSIKHALDPNGILNPGVLFANTES